MRLLVVALLPLAACDGVSWGPPDAPASESGLLMSTSSTYLQLDSAAMSDDGENFFAVMEGTTWCSFASDDAYMEMDTTADQTVDVQDIYAYTPLVATTNGLAYINESGVTRAYWNVANVAAARFRAGGSGAVVYTTGGRVRWFDGEAATDVVEVGACAALDLDRAGDTAWLACEAGVVRASGADAVAFSVTGGASHVAWSASAAMVLAVGGDRQALTALDAAGGTLWTSATDAPVVDLVAIAGRPLFAALLDSEAGSEVVLLSSDTGEVVDRLPAEGTRIGAAHDTARIVIHGGYTTSVYDVE